MEAVRVLIADDEPLGREKMRALVSERPNLHVVAEVENGSQAVEFLQNNTVDLVFLDIEMPGEKGIDVVKKVGPINMPAVIFCTAYDEYALEAFKVHALDYLLKPVEKNRFNEAVDIALKRIEQSNVHELHEKLQQLVVSQSVDSKPVERFMIRSHQEISFVKSDHIDWVEASGNYVTLHVGKDRHLIRQTMKEIESKLDATQFFRIHRSTIVNMDRVKTMKQLFNGEYEVQLQSGKRLTLSRTFKKGLERFL